MLLLLVRLALRNLVARRVNLVVGALVLLSTCLLVLAGAVRSAMEAATAQTLTKTFLGHLHLFSSDSEGELTLFSFQDDTNFVPIQELERVTARVRALPLVQEVVPLATGRATLVLGNLLDERVGELRAAVAQREWNGVAPRPVPALVAQLRHVLQTMSAPGHERLMDAVLLEEEGGYLAQVGEDAFWAGLEADPLPALDLLDAHLAPLLVGSPELDLAFTGLDVGALTFPFDHFEVVDGAEIPAGARGLLLPKLVYEDSFKLGPVRRLDRIAEALGQGRSLEDPELSRWLAQVKAEVPLLLLHLDPARAEEVRAALAGALGVQAPSLTQALLALLEVTPQSFSGRYETFYQVVAPALQLYLARPGEALPLLAQARSGYSRSARITFYGTYKLRGLAAEHPPASEMGIIDLASMNELLGFPTAEEQAELEALSGALSVSELSAEALEAALFAERVPADAPALPVAARAKAKVYAGPVALSAAVWLSDPDAAQQTLEAITAIAREEGLGVAVVPWQQAAGFMSSLAAAFSAALLGAVALLFLIVIFVLNNTVMTITLQRVKELGTIRAIGGSKGLVLGAVMVEAIVLCALFGGAGALLGGALIGALGQAGIPSPDPAMDFFFGGPSLFPVLAPAHLGLALATVVGVGALASLYPAIIATRVSPIRSMQAED